MPGEFQLMHDRQKQGLLLSKCGKSKSRLYHRRMRIYTSKGHPVYRCHRPGRKKWRLLERQYSFDGNDILKRLLVDKLIQGGHIDGYKIVGASCHEANTFVGIDGSSLSDRKFEIDSELGEEDTISYQDSFKWYCYGSNKAYNYPHNDYSYELDTTDLNLYGDEDDDGENEGEWDEYHQYHCTEITLCYWHGREINVDSENMGNFIYIESKDEYHHKSDCKCCNECQNYIPDKNAEHSDITGEHYCCIPCMDKAEEAFKRDKWHYSEYDGEWYEDLNDITRIHIWNGQRSCYVKQSVCKGTLERLITEGKAREFDGEAFDRIDPLTGLPYDYEPEKKETT